MFTFSNNKEALKRAALQEIDQIAAVTKEKTKSTLDFLEEINLAAYIPELKDLAQNMLNYINSDFATIQQTLLALRDGLQKINSNFQDNFLKNIKEKGLMINKINYHFRELTDEEENLNKIMMDKVLAHEPLNDEDMRNCLAIAEELTAELRKKILQIFGDLSKAFIDAGKYIKEKLEFKYQGV